MASQISQATGHLPFSLAELTIIGLILLLLWKIVSFIIKLFSRPINLLGIGTVLFKSLGVIIAIYMLFLLLWGFNYYRLPFSDLIGLEVGTSTSSDLEELCTYLVEQTNELRTMVEEDHLGFMTVSSSLDVLKRAKLGYEEAALVYPQLAGSYGQPKKVVLSRLMSYLGIWGVYFPFTAEANINVAIPYSQLPAIVCHEMAHQRGFAREDEANYIAYLTCKYHPDADFQYSGHLLALIHSIRVLQKHDPILAAKLQDKYSSGVRRDLVELRQFSLQHQGPLENISSQVNDYYLKVNNQKEGVKSYGRMVELLLAEYKKSPGAF